MRVMIVVNPRSGSGRAARAGDRIDACLRQAGYDIDRAETHGDRAEEWLDDRLQNAGALLVVGGDGAVRSVAATAIRTGTPIYHVPYGTANLFARAFGMNRRADIVLRALRCRHIHRVDAGIANGQTFVLMASIGYDAQVVYDLANRRRRAISRLSYVAPMLRQLFAWRPMELAVTVDGERIDLDTGCGLLIAANCRHYMWRLDPVRRAVMTDGQLDVAVFPARSRSDLLRWILKCAAGRQLADPALVYRTGRRVEIVCREPQRLQIDGDPPAGPAGSLVRKVDLSVQPRALGVLLPAR